MALKKDLFFPDNAPPPYVMIEPEINNSDTLISLPEVIASPDGGQGTEPLLDEFSFSNKKIRQDFIKKVYSIVLMQLLFTAAVIAWFITDTRVQFAIAKFPWLFLGVTVTMYLSTFIAMMCFEPARRRVPYNYICLTLFTASLALMIAVGCYDIPYEEVLITVGVTFAVVLALTLFAFQTKIDFTLINGSIISLILILCLFGIATLFTPYSWLHLLSESLIVLLLCLHLLHDTQMMIGGKHRCAISPEEYVFAALCIYVDIMHIFVKVLEIVRR